LRWIRLGYWGDCSQTCGSSSKCERESFHEHPSSSARTARRFDHVLIGSSSATAALDSTLRKDCPMDNQTKQLTEALENLAGEVHQNTFVLPC
jgi:hypothetical protein